MAESKDCFLWSISLLLKLEMCFLQIAHLV